MFRAELQITSRAYLKFPEGEFGRRCRGTVARYALLGDVQYFIVSFSPLDVELSSL